MFKRGIVLLSLCLLEACSGWLSYPSENADTGYFSDASDCLRSSLRREQIKVPTGNTMSVIEVVIGNDAAAFGHCMENAGHPAKKADLTEYLKLSSDCLQEARSSSTPDDTYGKCVRRGKITVETIIDDQ